MSEKRYPKGAVYRERLRLRETKGKVMLVCPFHSDTDPSFSVDLDKGVFYCFGGCDEPKGGNQIAFETKWAKIKEGKDIPQWVAKMRVWGIERSVGRVKVETEIRETVPRQKTRKHVSISPEEIEQTYPYRDEQGTLLFEVVRLKGKRFLQRHPKEDGTWEWNLNGVRRVLYRLPEILEAKPPMVLFVEGEKDVDRLWSLGWPATTNPGGAGREKWKPEYAEMLKAAGIRNILIIPDNDDVGREHAVVVKESCRRVGILPAILFLDVKEKGDVSDWLDAGHTLSEINTLPRNW